MERLTLHERALKHFDMMADNCKLSETARKTAIPLLGKIEFIPELSSSKPLSLAAGVVYIAAVMNGENLSQQMLSQVSGVSETSIRNNYKKIKRTLQL
jgi:transcription initiation factor TFIIIB Brf1 subunit/transcription initiation factor TFIIB